MESKAIGALLIFLAFVGTFLGGEWRGKTIGANAQKVADQVQFDKINGDLTKQKKEATALYIDLQGQLITALAERDILKTKLEKQHADHLAENRNLERMYAGRVLQFTTTREAAGCGSGGAGAGVPEGSTPSPTATATVQLPDVLSARLRRLNAAGDDLIADYEKCYGYVNR